MRSCVVLLFASLLTLCEAQGTSVTPVFVPKGRDLLLKLHADPPEGVLFVDWKFNEKVTLVRFIPGGEPHVDPRFTGRVQFGENKFSVILKNVQEVDSGVYSAEARTLQGVKLLTEYKVTVQGPVSPVELIVDRVDSNSSESCDLHVTCRTHNSNISSTFRCSKRVCSQEGGERPEVTTSGASLQVHLLNNMIICNHRNQVHRTHDLIHAEQLCYPSTGTIVTPVFVQKGRDLLLKLHADPPERFLAVDWKINKNVTLVRFDPSGEATVHHNVTGGFEFPENKFSVILKNVQEVDSGVYSAVAVTLEGDKLAAEYQVTVQGPVSPVELIVDRVDNSSESCDLHVTCRTHNAHISRTFRCVDQVCSHDGGQVTTSGASLYVYLLNNVINCDHNNQVHRTHNLIHAEQLCYPSTGTIVTPVFVPKGRDLLLNLHADPPEGVSFVDWKINKIVTLVRFKHSGEATVIHNVTGRVQLGKIKFSVRLKNVQEVDSGVYSAVAGTLEGDKLLTEYKVTVQDCTSHLGWVIAGWILSLSLIVIVGGLIVCLYTNPKGLIRLIQRHQATKDEDALDKTSAPQNPTNVVTYSSGSDKLLNEKSASLKNMSPAEAPGPSYSSVPSAAEPTDP